MQGLLLAPSINNKPATWGQATDHIAKKFNDTIAAHGPDAVAFYVSGQLLTEDYYVANKFMKGFIGSANIDTNSRLCMASSVAGHKRAFGADTVPGVYEDLELADLITLTGSNFAWCHPVLFRRSMDAREKRPHIKLVVIDPRRTATADIANLYLPIKSGADTALFNGLFHHLREQECIDYNFINDHTNGYDDIIQQAPQSIPELVDQSGLNITDIEKIFELVVTTDRTVTVYSQGVNQSTAGTDKVSAIINSHLITGRIGKPGMGLFSVTGQPNAMGGREVGGLANQLACHM
jgi:assimilatory nitrate reductase catalytic subunit